MRFYLSIFSTGLNTRILSIHGTGFGNGAPPLLIGSVRGTWRDGSYTVDTERHVMEGSGKGAFHF